MLSVNLKIYTCRSCNASSRMYKRKHATARSSSPRQPGHAHPYHNLARPVLILLRCGTGPGPVPFPPAGANVKIAPASPGTRPGTAADPSSVYWYGITAATPNAPAGALLAAPPRSLSRATAVPTSSESADVMASLTPRKALLSTTTRAPMRVLTADDTSW